MMEDKQKVKALITLLDDESPRIREKVRNQLLSFDNSLEKSLSLVPMEIIASRHNHVFDLIMEYRRKRLLTQWQNILDDSSLVGTLERVYSLLSDYFSEKIYPQPLSLRLDQLSDHFFTLYEHATIDNLLQFICIDQKFIGNKKNYYDPYNSDLGALLTHKKGIPISLTSLMILLGNRIGLTIEGCPYPSHFLGKAQENDHTVLIDVFNNKVISNDSTLTYLGTLNFNDALLLPLTTSTFIIRILNNIKMGFETKRERNEAALIGQLIQFIKAHNDIEDPSDNHPSTVRFKPGDLIFHKNYKYRGVIVECDESFEGSETWYNSNQTKPEKDQPWYHVLVHNANHTTYVAQSNLRYDVEKLPISHPLLSRFFRFFKNGKYYR